VSTFRTGDRVRIKPASEIAKTLDEHGRYESLPFMPEMLEFCGREFVVSASAHKTCDTVNKTGGRSLPNTVHLANLRCSGASHGGCDAYCLFFWKDVWLEPASVPTATVASAEYGQIAESLPTQHEVSAGVTKFSCQATELPRYTKLLRWWDLRQYVKDVSSGNRSVSTVLKLGLLKWIQNRVEDGIAFYPFLKLYNALQARLGGVPQVPDDGGPIAAGKRTPSLDLRLRPGEYVFVKSFEEIRETLDATGKNRGMRFDAEMKPYCGQRLQVAKRVERIINEKTGEMIQMKNPGIILEGGFCGSKFSKRRMFCPRALPGFWREIWLRRADENAIPVVELTTQ